MSSSRIIESNIQTTVFPESRLHEPFDRCRICYVRLHDEGVAPAFVDRHRDFFQIVLVPGCENDSRACFREGNGCCGSDSLTGSGDYAHLPLQKTSDGLGNRKRRQFSTPLTHVVHFQGV